MRVKLKVAMNLFTDHMKIEESEFLPKNFDPCAISRESLLFATSSNKEFHKRVNVNEILGQNVSLKVTQMSVFRRLGIHIT